MKTRSTPHTIRSGGLISLVLLAAWSPRSSPSQTAGCEEIREELDRYLASVPRVRDPVLDRELTEIMTRLLRSARYPGLRLEVLVLDSDQIGAYATPCDQILITKGILDWQESLGMENASASDADPIALGRAYTASVLAHELAHVTLGHAGELVERPLGLLSSVAGEATQPRRELQLEGAAVQEARYSQEREIDADRLGALYLLRSGWEMQHAMDTFRGLDELERTDPEGCFYCLEATSYLSTHPRSSEREASVEGFRAELKRLQAAFDDALTLIIHNAELDHAIALLDQVLAVFPDLLQAKHARAVAQQTQWANGLAVQELQVMMSLPTYEARFLTGIKGEPELPNRELLEQARKGYHEVMLHEHSPYTLSNLAVLDAYAGNSGPARRWAELAVEMAPRDVQVLNNLGVVLYLNGDLRAAKAAFERAASAPGGDGYPSVTFNLGATLTGLGEERGRDLLISYLGVDPYSGWSQEAMRLAGLTSRGATPKSELPAPAVAGVHLLDPPEAVAAALGGPPPPEDQRMVGISEAWTYEDIGLRVYLHATDGVSMLMLTKPGVASVFGVDIDQPLDAFREAAQQRELVPRLGGFSASEDEPRWIVSPPADWEVSVAAMNGTIISICVRRTSPAISGG